jgi:hypothetical protein
LFRRLSASSQRHEVSLNQKGDRSFGRPWLIH